MDKKDIIDQIEQTQEAVKQAKIQYYLSHFYEFNRDVIGWKDIYEPLHRKVCDFIQDNIGKKKLLILLPRGVFKSSLITIGYTLWRIAQNSNERILIANATYPMACQFLSQVKDYVSKSETFMELFGNLSAEADSWREDRITVARERSYEQKEPTAVAFGMGSNLVGSHYTLAILDDMVNRENITTREQIEKVINFYKDTLDLLDPDAEGRKNLIVIGTTWHYSDLYSWIQDPDTAILQDFEVLKMPAYTGEWGKGELLFPSRLSWNTLEELKRQQGSSHFAAQYMLDPVLSEDAVFKFDFKYYEKTDLTGIELNKFITIDPAISQKKEADYTAMICVGVDKMNNWYVLDIWREQCQPKRLLDQLFYWDSKWKPISVGIETTAFQKTLQYFAYEEMKRKNHFIPLKELTHTELSKDQRIRGLEPRYETGSVFHCKQVPFTDYLEDELRRYDRGKNDDLIDALASQLELAFPLKFKTERRNRFKRANYPG
jgi:hypothetical protein